MPGGLGIWVIAAVVAIITLLLVYNGLTRDSNIRSTRYGFFSERQRFDDSPDIYTYAPFQEDSMTREAPDPTIPPPTPPPPAPTPEPDPEGNGDEEAVTRVRWPQA
jgi:hypothetical protein